MDRRVLMVFLSLWSSGLWTEVTHSLKGERDIIKKRQQSKVHGVRGDVRLVEGANRCAGRPEVKVQGEWKVLYKPKTEKEINKYKPMNHRQPETNQSETVDDHYYDWNLKLMAQVCRRLDCGSFVSLRTVRGFPYGCVDIYRSIRFSNQELSYTKLEITCSDSVRLVKGTNLCSGRLQVRSNQSNQRWSSVCEDGFDLQDAEVVCRQLGCAPPSVLQGALYGDMEAPVWTKEFQCEGNESALLDCRSSDRNTCSPGRAVGLTCSEPGGVRLAGGASRCSGVLEMKKLDEWKPVAEDHWNPRVPHAVCGRLGCGSVVSVKRRWEKTAREFWRIKNGCNASSLVECETGLTYSFTALEITCSESIRLVNGTNLCSGRLEVKSHQSNQRWSSVCEDGFDQQDAEVVCRQLDCGAPSVLQGALYGDVEGPVWPKEFQCGGHESALLDCDSSDRNTSSPGRAVGLTCSDPPDDIRLVGESSRCAGELEMKHQKEWRSVAGLDRMSSAAVCRQLECGFEVVTVKSYNEYSVTSAWWINSSCVPFKSTLEECLTTREGPNTGSLKITCSGWLAQPNISPSPSADGVSEATQQGHQVLIGSDFTITCSMEPQFPRGFFQLIFTNSSTTQSYTLPAVNHSAHFLFPAADRTHRGEYRCVYHIYDSSLQIYFYSRNKDSFSRNIFFHHNVSSESQPLCLAVLASLTELMIRLVVLLLGVMSLIITALRANSKASRIQKSGQTEIKDDVLGGSEGRTGDEAGAQRTE